MKLCLNYKLLPSFANIFCENLNLNFVKVHFAKFSVKSLAYGNISDFELFCKTNVQFVLFCFHQQIFNEIQQFWEIKFCWKPYLGPNGAKTFGNQQARKKTWKRGRKLWGFKGTVLSDMLPFTSSLFFWSNCDYAECRKIALLNLPMRKNNNLPVKNLALDFVR